MPLRVVPRRDRKLNREVKAREVVPLRRGEILYRPGEPADRIVLVRRGHLRLVSPGRGGSEERTVHVVGPWEITGEEALVPGSTCRYLAVAGETSAVQSLDPGRVASALATSRVTREAFHAAWLEELHHLRHLSAGSGGPQVAPRLAALVLHLADRLGEPTAQGMRVPVQLTHRTLADLAGAHRSTVTTLLNAWLYEGWLGEGKPGLLITNRQELCALAGLPPEGAR